MSHNIDKCSILIVYYKPDGGISEYIQDDIDFFSNLGCDLEVFNMYEEKTIDESKKYDVIWVCGGNTFLILDRMKKTGVFDFVKYAVLGNESIYVGISAGSIIAGPSIEIAGEAVGDYDENVDDLKDLRGLGFVGFVTFPHFEENMQEEIDKYREKVDYSVIEISDEEAIYVDREGCKIIV